MSIKILAWRSQPSISTAVEKIQIHDPNHSGLTSSVGPLQPVTCPTAGPQALPCSRGAPFPSAFKIRSWGWRPGMEEGPGTDALDPQFPKLNYQNPTTNHGHSIRTHLFMNPTRGEKKRDLVIFLFFSPAHLKTRSQKNPLSPALDSTSEGVIQRGERERERRVDI